MVRSSPDDCMLCAIGDCPTHAPKVKPAKRVIPPKIVQPARAEEVTESAAAAARRSKYQADEGDQEELWRAVRCLVPILADEELIMHRERIGAERVDWQLKVNQWKRGRRK